MAVMAVHYQHERAQKKGGAYGSNKRATIKQVLFFLSFTNLGAFTPDGHCHYCQKGSLKGLVRYGQTPENSWRGWRTSRRHVQKQHFLRSQLRTLACPVGLGWSRRRYAGIGKVEFPAWRALKFPNHGLRVCPDKLAVMLARPVSFPVQ